MGAHLGQGAGETFALAGVSPSGARHGNWWASGAPWNLPYMFLFKGATSFPFLLGVWQAVSASWWHLLQDRVWQGRLYLWLWEEDCHQIRRSHSDASVCATGYSKCPPPTLFSNVLQETDCDQHPLLD